MPYSPHHMTACLPVEQRLSLARGDADAGRMTAADVVDLAEELIEQVRGDAEDQIGSAVEKLNREAEDAEDARREAEDEAEDLERQLQARETEVKIVLDRMAVTEKELRASGRGGVLDANRIRDWADRLRKAFEITPATAGQEG